MPRHASERNDGSPLQRDGPVTENSENCSGKNVRAARGADMTMDAATSECSGRERTSRCARTGVRTTRRAVLQSKADERGDWCRTPSGIAACHRIGRPRVSGRQSAMTSL